MLTMVISTYAFKLFYNHYLLSNKEQYKTIVLKISIY